MPRKSKVEKSPHYNEIVDMIKESISPRDISDYLKNEYDETISHTSINNFRKKIRSRTNQEYYKKKKKSKNTSQIIKDKKAKDEKFDSVVAEGVNNIDSLDRIIAAGKDINLDVSEIVEEFGPRGGVIVSKFDVLKAHALVANLVIKANKVRSDILKDEPESPDINVNFNNDLNSFFKEQREAAIKKTAEKDDSQ